jgi:hypothetical protein
MESWPTQTEPGMSPVHQPSRSTQIAFCRAEMTKYRYVFFSNPVGTIHTTESAFDSEAPIVAGFSSPGPNMITPQILKVVRSSTRHNQPLIFLSYLNICMNVAA